MSEWRKQAEAIRARIQKRKPEEIAATAPNGSEATLPQQRAYARKIIREVLTPVLADFVAILSGTPGEPVQHEYGPRAYGVTCDLNSHRFVVNVYLLSDSLVRIAVFLVPSLTEPHHRDFALSAGNDEIEAWIGSSLVKLYESR